MNELPAVAVMALEKMELTEVDRVSTVNFLKWVLKPEPSLELPGMAMVSEFLLALDALQLQGAEEEQRQMLKEKVMAALLAQPKRKRKHRR